MYHIYLWQNSMPISSLKICTVWKGDSGPFSFLAHNFKSPKKRWWIILPLFFENICTFWLIQNYSQRNRKNKNNKGKNESPWNILSFLSTPPRDWLLHVKSTLHTFILSEKIPSHPNHTRHFTIQEHGTTSYAFYN